MGPVAPEDGHYGLTVAILTGDVQHAWAVLLLTELANRGVSPAVVVSLIAEMAGRTTPMLVEGEMLDVQLPKQPLESITEAEILDMLWKKTGILYEFAGLAGSAIARRQHDLEDSDTRSIGRFCSLCGLAFQIQDDILGVVGDEHRLGKSVASDLREGKRTIIVAKTFEQANPSQKEFLQRALGNSHLSEGAAAATTKLMLDLGGIDYARTLAQKYVEDALPYLDVVPASRYKDMLTELAAFMVVREY